VVVVDSGGIGAGASGRNGGFLFRQPLGWVNDLLGETLEIYEEVATGPVPFDLTAWPMLVLAVEEGELEAARAYAEAVGGEEVDLGADPWFADDLAGGFVVEGGWTLDAMGATTALAEAARRDGVEFRLGCEAKRVIIEGGRVTGLATDEGILPCERVVLATGPWLRLLLRSLDADLPVTSSRGWLLETGRVDPQPRYAIEQALWPMQDEMASVVGSPTVREVADGATEEPGIVSLLLGARPGGRCLIGTSLRRSLLDEAEGPETVRRLAERAARVSPALANVPVLASWSGRRAHTPDGLPVVGPVPGIDGLVVAGGFSSIGMVTAPAACRRLTSGDTALFDPGRFGAD
jgi:glycine/D-amino acid oxidase-like deaminating enzyme